MVVLKITDVKNFMSQLLMKETFDGFLTSEINISNYNTFLINGKINRAFFSDEEWALLEEKEYSFWKKLRPFCFDLIKGNKTPAYLKAIYLIPHGLTNELLLQNSLPFSPEDINGLFLNVKYQDGLLTCTTGSSLKIFLPDKSLDLCFETYIRQFFTQNSIDFEEI